MIRLPSTQIAIGKLISHRQALTLRLMILDYAHKVPSLMVLALMRVTLRFKYRVTVARGVCLPPCTYRGRMNTARRHAVRGEFLGCRST